MRLSLEWAQKAATVLDVQLLHMGSHLTDLPLVAVAHGHLAGLALGSAYTVYDWPFVLV